MQLTPGPWTYQATAGDHDYVVYSESTGRTVALVRDFNPANAALMAAAPELLEVLKKAVADTYLLTMSAPLEEWQIEAQAAIAKAEGR